MSSDINKIFPKTGINKHVTRYISKISQLSGKKVVDIPAGDGRASFCFTNAGANVTALDLFPEFFQLTDVTCQFADLQKTLPVVNQSVDYVISQEGIEHVSNQYQVFCEFNRILKSGGELLLTTPNFSNLRCRLSYFLVESDYWKRPAPSEVDSIWFSSTENSKLYFGHLFLLNIQKLRALAKVTGFEIKEIVATDISATSLVLAIVLYPILLIANVLSILLSLGKNKHVNSAEKFRIHKEQILLNLNWKILACKHLFIVFRKQQNDTETLKTLRQLTTPTTPPASV